MTKETEVALAAIDALCKKRKAKALRKLVLAAVESERCDARATSYFTVGTGGVTATNIDTAQFADGTVTPTNPLRWFST